MIVLVVCCNCGMELVMIVLILDLLLIVHLIGILVLK